MGDNFTKVLIIMALSGGGVGLAVKLAGVSWKSSLDVAIFIAAVMGVIFFVGLAVWG